MHGGVAGWHKGTRRLGTNVKVGTIVVLLYLVLSLTGTPLKWTFDGVYHELYVGIYAKDNEAKAPNSIAQKIPR